MAKLRTAPSAPSEVETAQARLLSQPESLGFALDEASESLNILYYGKEGTGKTTDAATAANTGQGMVLFINAEGGVKARALRQFGINVGRVITWPKAGDPVSYASLQELHQELLSALRDNPKAIYAVVMDSVTEIVGGFREVASDDRTARATKAGRDFDPTFVDRADYGVSADQAKRVLRKFRDLPCHFMITALERVDDATGEIGPEIQPAVATSLLGYVDYVLHTQANVTDTESEFYAQTRPQAGVLRGKDRFRDLPVTMINPTFERILAYAQGELTEASDPDQQAYTALVGARAAADAEAKLKKEQDRLARRAKLTKGTTKTEQD